MTLREKKQDGLKAIHAFTRMMSRKLRSTRAVTGCHVSVMPPETQSVSHVKSAFTKIAIFAYQSQHDLSQASHDTVNLLVTDAASTTQEKNLTEHHLLDAVITQRGEHKSFAIILHRVLRHIASFGQSHPSVFSISRWGAVRTTTPVKDARNCLVSDFLFKKPNATRIHDALNTLVKATGVTDAIVHLSSDGALLEASITLPHANLAAVLEAAQAFKGLALIAIQQGSNIFIHIGLALHGDDESSLLDEESLFVFIKQDSVENKVRLSKLKEAS